MTNPTESAEAETRIIQALAREPLNRLHIRAAAARAALRQAIATYGENHGLSERLDVVVQRLGAAIYLAAVQAHRADAAH